MRPLLAILALVAITSTASAQTVPPTTVPGEALFVISGRGYGHGVGMSQYGAYGMARAGRTYDQILTNYYTGIQLGTAATKDVKVLLGEGRRAVTVASTAPLIIRDAAGETFRFPAGPLTLRPDFALVTPEGPVVAVPPLVVRAGKSAPLSLDGRLYRGTLQVTVQAGFLRVINIVGLESYLQGVVAGEMPDAWPLEALRAQAVAARSYALANLVKGKPFDLYSDVRSQVYLGIAGETPRATEAVSTTAGEVALYGGKVASTLYFSSSGGKTASAADVFGVPVPYLVSRPDPWDKLSPYFRWGPIVVGARTVQAKLGLDGRVLDATGITTPSSRLRSLVVQTTSGAQTIPASLFRTTLGLRSTWMSIGVLRLDRPGGPVVFGSSLRLNGVSRGVTSPMLTSSPDGVVWTAVGPVVTDGAGNASVIVKPARTTRYRVEAAGVASQPLLVQVSPLLQLVRQLEPVALTGTLRPKLAGVAIAIERRSGTSWIPVGQATTDSMGGFRVSLSLVPGSYRARVSANAAFVAGTSPELQVTG